MDDARIVAINLALTADRLRDEASAFLREPGADNAAWLLARRGARVAAETAALLRRLREIVAAEAIPEGHRRCGHCGHVRPAGRFARSSGRADGWSDECYECACARIKDWRRRNPEKARALSRRHERKVREDAAKWRALRRAASAS